MQPLPLRAVRPTRPMQPMRIFFAITLLGAAVLFASERANAQQSASVAISVKDLASNPAK